MRRALEVVWLSWPFGFKGMEIDILLYGTDDRSGYCIRCGFLTLDDA